MLEYKILFALMAAFCIPAEYEGIKMCQEVMNYSNYTADNCNTGCKRGIKFRLWVLRYYNTPTAGA